MEENEEITKFISTLESQSMEEEANIISNFPSGKSK